MTRKQILMAKTRAECIGALKLHRGATFGEVSNARSTHEVAGKHQIPSAGTATAIYNYALGVSADSPPKPTWGGPRNRADRETHALTVAQVANLKAAECHARTIGLPFTRMITIHWEAAGLLLESMAAATGRFTGLMAKALSRHGSRTAWVWVHENGPTKGGHCHMLVHVPAALVPTIKGLQLRWLRRISGRPYRARVIHSRPIGSTLGLETSNPNLHAANVEAALDYILKGASREAVTQFKLDRVEAGGRIIGKRCGTSQNIGAKARQTTGSE